MENVLFYRSWTPISEVLSKPKSTTHDFAQAIVKKISNKKQATQAVSA